MERLSPSLSTDEVTTIDSKQPRCRTKYTSQQLRALEIIFQQTPYPDINTMEKLAIKYNLSDYNVRTWFKNKRSKQRKVKNSFSFPMDTWRIHGKSLLPPTRMPGSQECKMEAVISSNMFQINSVEQQLPSSSHLTENIDYSSYWPSNSNINGAIKNSTNLSINTTNASSHNDCLEISRKYPADTDVKVQPTTNFKGANSSTMDTSASHSLQHCFTSSVDDQPHATLQPEGYGSSIPAISLNSPKKLLQKNVLITPEQSEIMEYIFQVTTRDPNESFVEELAQSMHLSAIVIKDWFANQRAKLKTIVESAVLASPSCQSIDVGITNGSHCSTIKEKNSDQYSISSVNNNFPVNQDQETCRTSSDFEANIPKSSLPELEEGSPSVLPDDCQSLNSMTNIISKSKDLLIAASGENTAATSSDTNIHQREIDATKLPPIKHLIGCPDVNQCFCHLATFNYDKKKEFFNADRLKILKFISQKTQCQVNLKSVLDKRKKSKSSTKSPRNRTYFSPEYLKILKYIFQQTPYPDASLIKFVTNLLSLSPPNVKSWFKNERKKRKIKANRGAGGLNGPGNLPISVTDDRVDISTGDLPILNEKEMDSSLPCIQNSHMSSSADPFQNPIAPLNHPLPLDEGPLQFSEEDPLQLSNLESSISVFFDNLKNEKKTKYTARNKKRNLDKARFSSKIDAVPLQADKLPLTYHGSDFHFATNDEVQMDLHTELKFHSLEKTTEALFESTSPLVNENKNIDIMDHALKPVIVETPGSSLVDVKEDIEVKFENLEESTEKLEKAISYKQEEMQVKGEISLEFKSCVTETASLVEEGSLIIDAEVQALNDVRNQDVDINPTPKIDLSAPNSSLAQLIEDIDIKLEDLEEPADYSDGIGQEISEHALSGQPEEEELEVFDGLQNLKLPLFTIQYPRDVAHPSSNCVISVAVIASGSHGAEIVSLSNTDTVKKLDKRKHPIQKPREYFCDMQVGICRAKFKTWKHLEDHRKTHLHRGRNRKTYECFYYSSELEKGCNVTVSKKSTLEKHMREHHFYDS